MKHGAILGMAGVAGLLPAGAFDEVTGGHRHITQTGSEPGWEFSVGALWESRYLTEGRDNLDGDGLFSAQFEAAYGSLTASLWVAASPDSSYREDEVALSHAWEWGRFTVEAGGALIWFPDDGGNDQEIGVKMSYALTGNWELHWHLYHSFEAGGVYQVGEFVSTGWEFGPLEVTGKLGAGFNGGYIEDGHRGLDHLSVTAEAAWSPDETWTVVGRLVYSHAIDRDPARRPGDAALFDGVQVGIGVAAGF